MRAVLAKVSDGAFEYVMDNGAKIAVKISVNREQRQARIDFTGSSLQLPNNFNAPAAVCKTELRAGDAVQIETPGGGLDGMRNNFLRRRRLDSQLSANQHITRLTNCSHPSK